MKRKKKKNRLTDGEMRALFHTSLLNPDLYPDKKKRIKNIKRVVRKITASSTRTGSY